MKPDFITFTGADDSTDIGQMQELARDYPVEFGILFSHDRSGSPRYPSNGWVRDFLLNGDALSGHTSAHICGSIARGVVAGGGGFNPRGFMRVQVNTRVLTAEERLKVRAWARRHQVMPILQTRAGFPDDLSFDWLFDCSGGQGVEPSRWPIWSNTDKPAGFAGGLNPQNVAHHATTFDLMGGRHWIDMETGVRNDEDKFDLGLCRKVCEAVYGPPS